MISGSFVLGNTHCGNPASHPTPPPRGFANHVADWFRRGASQAQAHAAESGGGMEIQPIQPLADVRIHGGDIVRKFAAPLYFVSWFIKLSIACIEKQHNTHRHLAGRKPTSLALLSALSVNARTASKFSAWRQAEEEKLKAREAQVLANEAPRW